MSLGKNARLGLAALGKLKLGQPNWTVGTAWTGTVTFVCSSSALFLGQMQMLGRLAIDGLSTAVFIGPLAVIGVPVDPPGPEGGPVGGPDDPGRPGSGSPVPVVVGNTLFDDSQSY